MQKALFAILVVASLMFPSKAQAQDMPPIIPSPPVIDLKWMYDLPPDTLIRMIFADLGPQAVDKALYITRRESGLGKRGQPVPYDPACAADNPRSSASGLFQFMGSWAGWGGYNWADVVGPDCLTDVLMAYEVVKTKGWGPWGG